MSFSYSFDTPSKPTGRAPRVGVVVGSGGIKAFAAIPLLRLLKEKDIPVELIIGTGGGGFMAALWSGGYDLSRMQAVFYELFMRDDILSVDTHTLARLTAEKHPRYREGAGLYRADGLTRSYEVIFKNMLIKDLKPKTLFYATDVRSGEGVIIDKGKVCEAVRACGAQYPIMPAVTIGNRLLMDGTLNSPLPVMEAVKRDMDVIVGVFLEDRLPKEGKNFLDCFMRMNQISARTLMHNQLFNSIDLHHYEILPLQVPFDRHVSPWEVESLPEILNAGKKAAADKLPEIKRTIRDFEKARKG